MNEDNWNPAEHITYMHCSEDDGFEKYYVVLNKKGEFVNTAKTLSDAVEKAVAAGLENHCWITALPKHGAPLVVPDSITGNEDNVIRNNNI